MWRARTATVSVSALLIAACGGGTNDGAVSSTVEFETTTTGLSTPADTAATTDTDITSTAAPAQSLPGVEDRDLDGDIAGSSVFDADILAKFDTLADPATCQATFDEQPMEPGVGAVVVVVTSIVDGCFTTTTETVAAVNVEVRIAELEATDDVIAVAEATSASELQAVGDPDSGDQWFLNDINTGMQVDALDALEHRQTTPVTVAVIDPGAVGDHKDFTDRPVIHAPWVSTVTDHATHVAGIIAATADNGIEGRGVGRNIQLLDAPVVGASLQQAISWAVDNGAQVINMSLCERDLSNTNNICIDEANTATAAIIENARRRGVLIFAAAGNCGNVRRNTSAWAQCDGIADRKFWPAAYPGVLGVAAYERNGERAWFSTANDDVDISAPGGDILSTTATGDGRWKGGTSQASPMAAGAAAIIIGHRPDIAPNRILSGLFAHTRDAGMPGWDTFYGSGRIDAIAVVKRFDEIEPWPPQPASTITPSAPVLRSDGIGDIAFGNDAEQAVAYFVSVLGPPTEDTGWEETTPFDPNNSDDQEACASPFMRYLIWPSLSLTFAEYEPAEGRISERRTFVAYSYYEYEPGQDTLNLQTDRGLRLGSPIAEAAAAHPDAKIDEGGGGGWVYAPDEFNGDFDQFGKLFRIVAGTWLCDYGW
jgi:hypothetical protein